MKIAFATTCTDDYTEYLRVFLKSIITHNPSFNIDFYVFTDKNHFSSENRNIILKLYSNTLFVNADLRLYDHANKKNIKYYSIELFNLNQFRNYDKAVFFGADVICLKPLDELYSEMEKVHYIGMTKEIRRPCFNNNCMIVDRIFLNNKTYYELLYSDFSNRNTYGTDQKLYNCYFENKIETIPHKFNVLVTEMNEINNDDIVFLHYIHKPLSDIGIKNLSEHQINLWKKYQGEN